MEQCQVSILELDFEKRDYFFTLRRGQRGMVSVYSEPTNVEWHHTLGPDTPSQHVTIKNLKISWWKWKNGHKSEEHWPRAIYTVQDWFFKNISCIWFFRYRTGDLIDPCFQAYILYIWLIFIVNLGVVLGVPLKHCSCLRCLCMVLRLHNSGEITMAASQNGSVLISFPS
jgi:hypothetical protein